MLELMPIDDAWAEAKETLVKRGVRTDDKGWSFLEHAFYLGYNRASHPFSNDGLLDHLPLTLLQELTAHHMECCNRFAEFHNRANDMKKEG